MLGLLSFLQTIFGDGHTGCIHDINHLVGQGGHGDRQVFDGFIVNTDCRIEAKRRKGCGLQVHRIGLIGRQQARLQLRGERGKQLRYDPDVGFGVQAQQVVGGVYFMQTIRGDCGTAYTPLAGVLPREAIGDIIDLSFGNTESGEGRRTALVPVGRDVVLGDLRHEGGFFAPWAFHVFQRTQHVLPVFFGILD